MTNQTTIRALTKLEFAYGLATRMAEAISDASPATQEMLGELLDYVEVTRSAVLLSAEHGAARGRRRVVSRRPPARPDAVAAGDVVPAGERDHHARSAATTCWPRRAGGSSTTPTLRPLIDEFLHGANGVDAEERAAVFRLAWDFVGSSLARPQRPLRALLPHLGGRNRISHHLRNVDRTRAYELVDRILAAGRKAGRLGEG